MRVLIIDDDHDVANVVRRLLQRRNHETEVAYSGQDGIRRAGEFRPDVVLCDIGLPDLDGFAVARELRANTETAGAVLVAITGYGEEEDKRQATEAGFDCHLVKPFEPQTLFQLLASLSIQR